MRRALAVPIVAALAAVGAASQQPQSPREALIARAKSLELSEVDHFEAIPGRGVAGVVNGTEVVAGNEAFMRERGVDPEPLRPEAERLASEGKTPVFVAMRPGNWELGTGNPTILLIAIADPIKPTAPRAVARLERMGLRVVMLTGDNRRTADAVARAVGVDAVVAEVMPAGKVDEVKRLQVDGHVVAMVGDGINDAPALAQADVGIAMGTGTDVAGEAGDIVLMRGDPESVADAIELARRTMGTMKQNLFWAFVYNIVGIPVAAGVLYPAFGFLLSPVLASAAMAMSSVSVVGNSLRLRRFKP